MRSMRFRHVLALLLVLAGGIIACGSNPGPTQTAQPGAATKLVFTVQPTNATAGVAIASGVQVAIQDASGNTVTSATDAVTIALGTNPGAGTLSGTLTVAGTGGIATFSNVRIDRIDRSGSGYTLAASAGGLSGATSMPFAVTLTSIALGTGGVHTCGLGAAGAAYCWGSNGEGEVGDGTTTNRSAPVLVAGGVTFAAVSAGHSAVGAPSHTCGVTAAGAAYCWGTDLSGQLGDGTTTTTRLSPVLVVGGVSFTAVSAGANHTCGVTAAGATYCWGSNAFGQVGDGTMTLTRSSPVLVAGGVSLTVVSAGYHHTCGVAAAGAAYCWGANNLGQLGDGTTTARLSPVLVGGGVTFTAVNAGDNHTCGITAAGAAYCWGSNASGQLGDGTTTNRLAPVLVAGGVPFAAVSAALAHTCGATAAGAAYCWGSNGSGQIGDGTTTTTRLSPVPVAGGVSFTTVRAGGLHTCGLTAAGIAYCWGANSSGELGDGTTTNRLTPVRVVQ